MNATDMSQYRQPEYPVNPLFVNRWSPRAMSGAAISDDELKSLFEAARWAPSAYNAQPWRFIYAMRDTEAWEPLFDLLVEFNQGWAKNASALVVIVSASKFEHNGQPSVTHAFDAGAAWMSLALQGTLRGLVVHGMAGFDYARAKTSLGIPEDYTVLAMAVIGRPGEVDQLPEALREREKPSDRKPLADIIMEGRFHQA